MRILCYLILLTLEISKAENDTLHMNDPLPQNETEQSEEGNNTRIGRSLRIFYLTGPTRRRRANKLSDLKLYKRNLQRVNGKERRDLMDPYDRPMIVLSTSSWPIELQETDQPSENFKWKNKMPMPPYETYYMKTTIPMSENAYNDGMNQQDMDNTKIYGMPDKRRKKQPWRTKDWPVKKITKQWYPNNDGMYTRYQDNTKINDMPDKKRKKKQPWQTKYWPVKKITKQWYPNNDGMYTQYKDNTKVYDTADKKRKKQPWQTKYWHDKKITKQWYPNNNGMYTRYKEKTKMYTKPWEYSTTLGEKTKMPMSGYPFTKVTEQQYSDSTGTFMATNFKPDSTIQDYNTNYDNENYDQYNTDYEQYNTDYDQYNTDYNQYNTDYDMYYQTPIIIQDYNYYAYPPYALPLVLLRLKRGNRMPTYRDPRSPLPRGRMQLRSGRGMTTILPSSKKRSLRDRRNRNLPYPLAFRARKNKQMMYNPTEISSGFNTDSMSYKPGRASDDQMHEEDSEKTSINFPTSIYPDYGVLGAQTKLLGKRGLMRTTDSKDSSLNYDYFSSRDEKAHGFTKSNADQQETELTVKPPLTTVDAGYVDKEPESKPSERAGENLIKTDSMTNHYATTSVSFSDDDIESGSKSSETNAYDKETESKANDYHSTETYSENADTEKRTELWGKSSETASVAYDNKKR